MGFFLILIRSQQEIQIEYEEGRNPGYMFLEGKFNFRGISGVGDIQCTEEGVKK